MQNRGDLFSEKAVISGWWRLRVCLPIALSKDIDKSTRVFLKKDRYGDGKLSEQEFVTHIAKSW